MVCRRLLLVFAVVVFVACEGLPGGGLSQPASISGLCEGALTDQLLRGHQTIRDATEELLKENQGDEDLQRRRRLVLEIAWDSVEQDERSWQRLNCAAILYPDGRR